MGKEIAKVKGKQSLRFKTSLLVITLVSAIALVSGGLSAYLSFSSTRSCLELSITETAKASAQTVTKQLGSFTVLANEIATESALSSADSTPEAKTAFLASKTKQYEIAGANFYTAQGIFLSDNKDYSSSDFFKTASTGKTYIASPIVDKGLNQFVLPVSVPVWKDGVNGSSIVGVITFLFKQQELNSIIENIKVSSSGTAYMINKNGDTIAHSTLEKAIQAQNIISMAKTTPELSSLAVVQAKALKGGSGFDTYTYTGVKKFAAYSAVDGTDGWVIFVSAPEKEFTQGVNTSVYSSCIILLLAILLGIFMATRLTKSLSVPVTAIMHRLSAFADGDVTSPIPEVLTNTHELDSLKKSMQFTKDNTSAIITDIDYLLTEISNGNLDVDSKAGDKYVGDYKNILASIKRLKQGLSESFYNIMQVSEQVSAGSAHVSSGAQTLAQGATEQASSIQELSSSISEVAEHVRQNAGDAQKARGLTADSEVIMRRSVTDMELASQAMNEISATSKNIGKVIKAIDDIAFQTNILALNAAVEAARAGTAGKGFAVVADEVRNLSQKSAEAAKNTTVLIESSIEAIGKGTELVNKTSQGFADVAKKAYEIGRIVETISTQAEQQAEAVSQITLGIEQVSAVVQMNSATSEESAAASEQLFSQAAVLKNQVEKFTLAQTSDEE